LLKIKACPEKMLFAGAKSDRKTLFVQVVVYMEKGVK